MKKTIKKIVTYLMLIALTITYFIPLYAIKADEKIRYAKVNNLTMPLTFRVGATTNSASLGSIPEGLYELLEIASKGNGCVGNWYKIKNTGGQVGYICTDVGKGPFVDIVELDIDDQISDGIMKFPESYRQSLMLLKAKYPNWVFVADYTGPTINGKRTALDFDYVTSNQSYAGSGRSLIEDNGSVKTRDGLKHLDRFNYKTNTFNSMGGDNRWFAANKETVSYYIDPRNFLNESSIFQFEVLNFNEQLHKLEDVQNMLKGTFMEGKPNITEEDQNRNMTYAEIFYKAGKENNINPFSLVARVLQEVGRTRSVIVSGSYKSIYDDKVNRGDSDAKYWEWAKNGEYEKYFNFYNIGATESPNSGDIIRKGIETAKARGWNSEYKAIMGGASGTLSDYMKRDQVTKYYQKFDVVREGKYFQSQYQQNIEAPSSECISLYNRYKNSGSLNSKIIFKIPVYSNMPTKTELPHPGNPNNYLKTLQINGTEISGFNPEKYEYTFNVSSSTKKVTINSSTYASTSSITGNNTIDLNNEITTHNVVVKAQNNTTKSYKINIVKSDDIPLSVEDLLTEAKVKYNNNNISGIRLNTNITDFINNIQKVRLDAEVTIRDKNGKVKTNSKLGTGDKVNVKIGENNKEYSVVIFGDINGDGDVTIMDLLLVQKHILGVNLSGNALTAADVSKDGKVTILDLLRVQKHILRDTLIEQ